MQKLIKWLEAHEWTFDREKKGISFIYGNTREYVENDDQAEELYRQLKKCDHEYVSFESLSKRIVGSYQRDFKAEEEYNIEPLYVIKWTDSDTGCMHRIPGISKMNVRELLKYLNCFTEDEIQEDLEDVKLRLFRKIENDIREAFSLFNQVRIPVEFEDIKEVKFLRSQLEGLRNVVK